MTEAEWLAGTEPEKMLAFLRVIRAQASERKLRLFACACCRRIWRLLSDDRSRKAVMTAERFADGLATRQQLRAARAYAADAYAFAQGGPYYAPAAHAACARAAAARAIDEVVEAARCAATHPATRNTEETAQAALLRDLFGNPFGHVTLNPAWLSWNSGTVARLAQAIYDERRFADLPILADALEEAGCDSADVLAHCRSGGEHVRGCWVVDLLLGRE
jgi:hypothetical protein